MRKTTTKTKRRMLIILASVLAMAIAITGTYAWFDLSQNYRNTLNLLSEEKYDPILIDEFADGDRTINSAQLGQPYDKVVFVSYTHVDEHYAAYGGHEEGDECGLYLPTWVRVNFAETLIVTDTATNTSVTTGPTVYTGTEDARVEWFLSENENLKAVSAEMAALTGFDRWDGESQGAFWILDDDGWFYWGEPLQHGQATADLMQFIQFNNKSALEEITYHIDVQMEAIDANLSDFDKWTTQSTGVSEEIKYLLGVNYYLALDAVNFPDPMFRMYLAATLGMFDSGLVELQCVREVRCEECHCPPGDGCDCCGEAYGGDGCPFRWSDCDTCGKWINQCTCHEGYCFAAAPGAELSAAQRASVTDLDMGVDGACQFGLTDDTFQLQTLEGLAYFTELTYLNCGNCPELTELDVSANTKLNFLDCNGNGLSSLDVSMLPDLLFLSCGGQPLTSLDVSANTKLRHLHCQDNGLTSLDVSMLPDLIRLSCNDNSLTELDVSANTKLQYFYCYNNELTSLDVSMLSDLAALNCSNNSLTSLDVSGKTKMQQLVCSYNQISSLDIRNTGVPNNYYMFRIQNNNMTTLLVKPGYTYTNAEYHLAGNPGLVVIPG